VSFRIGTVLFAVALGALCGASPGLAAPVLPAGFSDQLVTAGFDLPVNLAFLPDGRAFVVERATARVRLIVNGAIAASDPVIAVDSVRTSHPEQGLLGIAVDPGWPARPYIYVQYDHAATPRIHIRRYTVGGDLLFTGNGSLTANPASRYEVFIDAPDNFGNHNGGNLKFGPDGKLYSSLGEDLEACYAQDPSLFYGKILRLDVSQLPPGPGGPAPYALITPADNPFVGNPDPRARLVWQYGLRNPWSFHFDPVTNEAFIADVGEARWEEIDIANAPGLNFGWPLLEGPESELMCSGQTGPFTPAAYQYDRQAFANGAAVIGGGVYRRPPSGASVFPQEYEGTYFFSDIGEGFIRRIKRSGVTWGLAPPATGQPNATDWATGYDHVTIFVEAADGSLWYVYNNFAPAGAIRRIAYDGTTAVPLVPGDSRVRFGVYPSPTHGATRVIVTLERPAALELGLYDLSGRLVRTLLTGPRDPGRHEARWDGRDESGRPVAPGVYFVRLSVDGATYHRRVLLVR